MAILPSLRNLGNRLYRWLITLGVPTRYLSLDPGAGAVDQLVVSVIDWK